MLPDLIAALGIVWIVGRHFNRPAVFGQTKVMRGLLVREAHRVIAAVVHLVMVRLAIGDGSCHQESELEKSFHSAGPFRVLPVILLVSHPGLQSIGHPSPSKRV